MKHSIQKRTIWIFAGILVLIIAACVALSYRNAYTQEVERNRVAGRSAAVITQDIFTAADLDQLLDPQNTELYNRTREQLRIICKSLSLSYLYVYTVDEKGIRHYVMTAADRDDIDALVAEALGLGQTSGEPLHAQEISAMHGEISDESYFLNNQYGKMSGWVTPYFDQKGNAVALIGADVNMDVQNGAILRQFLVLLLPVVGILVVAYVVLFFLMRHRILRPLQTVANHMEQFDPTAETQPLQIHTEDEIQQISDAFEKMSGEIRTYIQNIETITAQQQYDRAQMDVARRIQYGMVPASFRLCKGGVDVSSMMKPAKEVGGDFYDCFMLPGGQFCALIADVSGKGVAGALFMALTKNLVKDRVMQYRELGTALNSVNDELCMQNPEGMFVTVFALLLDPQTGTVRYANAGHNPPVLLKNGTAEFLVSKPGIALGLFDHAGIETETLTLDRGEGILLYTDGVTDAVNVDRAFFGKDRILSLMKETEDRDSRTVVSTLGNAVETFADGCDQFDDITVVAVIYRGAEAWTPLPVTMDAFKEVKQSILSYSGGNARKIVLACEEAFVNIVKYAGATEIDYRLKRDGDMLTVEFRDNGVRFDPFSETLKQDEEFFSMDEGGLGIRFIRTIASEASWNYVDGRNILTVSFNQTI